MKSKIWSVIAVFLMSLIALSGLAAAEFEPVKLEDSLEVRSLKVNGKTLESSEPGDGSDKLRVRRGDDLKVKLDLKAIGDDAKNFQIVAMILGYKYSDKEGETEKILAMHDVDSLDTGEHDDYELELQVPERMNKEQMTLRVYVGNGDDKAFEKDYELSIKGMDEEDSIMIKEIVVPSEVKAGRTLYGRVKIKNFGDNKQKEVTVRLSIPELGKDDTVEIDDIKADDSETSEELMLPIPACAPEKVYDVIAKVEFDEFESTEAKTQIAVVSSDTCRITTGPSTTINVGAKSQEVVKGQAGAVYPLTITNRGTSSKTYTVSVEGAGDWATTAVSPSGTFVVPSGESRTALVSVTAKDSASAGDHVFTVSVRSGTDAEQITMTANVVEGASSFSKVKRALEVGLVVLVVLLVIIGLIIGFSRLKGDDDEDSMDEESGQTYY